MKTASKSTAFMSKTDWVVMCSLVATMLFCFSMSGKWWFFLAGICASVTLAIGVGHWMQNAERMQNENNWNSFLDRMQDEDKPKEKSRRKIFTADMEN
jgi:cell division protein FtsW (lipid II flippase)